MSLVAFWPPAETGVGALAEYSHLPPEIRAKKYRDLAGDARREAALCKGALREAYLLIAAQWDHLAAEAEASIKDN